MQDYVLLKLATKNAEFKRLTGIRSPNDYPKL